MGHSHYDNYQDEDKFFTHFLDWNYNETSNFLCIKSKKFINKYNKIQIDEVQPNMDIQNFIKEILISKEIHSLKKFVDI